MKTVLVLRFSAMGDVAMTAAALREFAPAHSDVHFAMVSRPLFAPFFEGLDNVTFIATDFNKQYKGLRGLWRLFHDLRRQKPAAVADLHDVLRTKILRLLFRLWGFKVKKINKGRHEKRQLTRRHHKQLKPLQHTIARYTDVLTAAAAVCDMRYAMSDVRDTNYLVPCTTYYAPQATLRVSKIGIAPFAKHRGKIYPLGKMEKIVAHFAQLNNAEVYLFGGGAAEIVLLAEWEAKYSGVISLAGKMSLSEELSQLADMDVVVSMDSANMHMASLMGVTVVAVWGATHPFAGFTGWKQEEINNIQLDLPCRPCSVFGDKACFRHDYACMNIPEQIIIEKITALLYL